MIHVLWLHAIAGESGSQSSCLSSEHTPRSRALPAERHAEPRQSLLNTFDYRSEEQLEIVKTLARFGAKLPGDKDIVQEFRSVLLKMSWHNGLELLKELRAYGFADAEV